jgi:hypothetical protein
MSAAMKGPDSSVSTPEMPLSPMRGRTTQKRVSAVAKLCALLLQLDVHEHVIAVGAEAQAVHDADHHILVLHRRLGGLEAFGGLKADRDRGPRLERSCGSRARRRRPRRAPARAKSTTR